VVRAAVIVAMLDNRHNSATVRPTVSRNAVCSYGSADVSNRVMFQYQTFNVVIIATIGIILLSQQNLHRFYLPLARLVNITIALQLLSGALYFSAYPYANNEGNCLEIFVGELFTVCITFAEFHQLYIIATILGLGRHRFPVFGSLSRMLQALTGFTVVASILCGLYFSGGM
jgi:hypothetical protein